jgi:hypothetical protein
MLKRKFKEKKIITKNWGKHASRTVNNFERTTAKKQQIN